MLRGCDGGGAVDDEGGGELDGIARGRGGDGQADEPGLSKSSYAV